MYRSMSLRRRELLATIIVFRRAMTSFAHSLRNAAAGDDTRSPLFDGLK